jgi:FixJ family two-component response regulator
MVEYHKKRRINPETVPKKYTTHLVDQEGNIREVLARVDLIPQTKQSVASLVDVTDLRMAERQIAFQLDCSVVSIREHRSFLNLDLKLAQLAVTNSGEDFG